MFWIKSNLFYNIIIYIIHIYRTSYQTYSFNFVIYIIPYVSSVY